MAHFEGPYWGYREFPRVPGGARRGWHPPLRPGPIRLKWWQWELLGPFPFDWRVFSGVTENDYPDDFISVGFPDNAQSRAVWAIIRDNPAQIIFTYDGETEQDEREWWYGFIRLEAVRGFKIRSATPGLTASYVICFLR